MSHPFHNVIGGVKNIQDNYRSAQNSNTTNITQNLNRANITQNSNTTNITQNQNIANIDFLPQQGSFLDIPDYGINNPSQSTLIIDKTEIDDELKKQKTKIQK